LCERKAKTFSLNLPVKPPGLSKENRSVTGFVLKLDRQKEKILSLHHVSVEGGLLLLSAFHKNIMVEVRIRS